MKTDFLAPTMIASAIFLTASFLGDHSFRRSPLLLVGSFVTTIALAMVAVNGTTVFSAENIFLWTTLGMMGLAFLGRFKYYSDNYAETTVTQNEKGEAKERLPIIDPAAKKDLLSMPTTATDRAALKPKSVVLEEA